MTVRGAVALAVAIALAAATVTWTFGSHGGSGCSGADCMIAAPRADGNGAAALSGCSAFTPACAESAGTDEPAAGSAKESESCEPPCMSQDGQIIATGGGGDPWWLWSLWIAIATGVMVWGFRRELARLAARRLGAAADAESAARREWAARALARARSQRRDIS